MDFNTTLQKIGFTPLEATVFITLCKHGPLTGYEVAKLSGISRSNVYAALYNLQEKGKCLISEGETTKYMAISKEELLLLTERETKQTLAEIQQFFPSSVEVHEPYLTIKGYANVINKVKNSILLCTSHLYILCSSEYVSLFKEELCSICKDKRISIIAETPLDLPTSICTFVREKKPVGFHMIVDTTYVITADFQMDHAQCLYSKNGPLVRLIRESFVTELAMISIKK